MKISLVESHCFGVSHFRKKLFFAREKFSAKKSGKNSSKIKSISRSGGRCVPDLQKICNDFLGISLTPSETLGNRPDKISPATRRIDLCYKKDQRSIRALSGAGEFFEVGDEPPKKHKLCFLDLL